MTASDQLRALWVTRNYPHPADPVSGVFFRTQARALARASVQVDIVAPVPYSPPVLWPISKRWRGYGGTPRSDLDEGVSVMRPRYLAMPNQLVSGVPHVFMANAVRGAVRSRTMDVVHGHYAYPEGIVACRIAWERGVPAVITLHGSDVNVFPDVHPRARRRFERAVRGADAVLAVSEALAARTEVLTGVRPTVAPIGVDLRPFEQLPDREAARARVGLPNDRFLVLFVGHLQEPKGVRELLEALASEGLDDVWAVFVGDGPLAPQVRAAPRTLLAGVVPNERVPAYLAAADVLALPSHREGTPTVVVEAGAAGTPVVATDVGGTHALLKDGRGTLVPPHDVPALAAALRHARHDSAAGRARGAALKRYVWEHHSADVGARHLRELYRQLRASAPSTSR